MNWIKKENIPHDEENCNCEKHIQFAIFTLESCYVENRRTVIFPSNNILNTHFEMPDKFETSLILLYLKIYYLPMIKEFYSLIIRIIEKLFFEDLKIILETLIWNLIFD